MAQITDSDIARCYSLGVQFAQGQRSFDEAIDEAQKFGMNRASASDYIRNVKYMNDGYVYKRTISAKATQYYLEHFERDFGQEGLKRALSALIGHIEYYEGIQSATLHKQRTIYERFHGSLKAMASSPEAMPFALEQSPFSEVALLSEKELEKAAREASKGPRPTTQISTVVRQRNMYVREYVLRHAKGICQECKQPAPFIQKDTGRPFLEVHHRIPLSEDGDDTVENAVALCPNCHREAHHGENWKKFRP
ncbi:MAG: HNH endonuclease [Paracoccaceae bacterium]